MLDRAFLADSKAILIFNFGLVVNELSASDVGDPLKVLMSPLFNVKIIKMTAERSNFVEYFSSYTGRSLNFEFWISRCQFCFYLTYNKKTIFEIWTFLQFLCP